MIPTSCLNEKSLDAGQRRALTAAGLALLAGCVALALSAAPAGSAWRNPAGGLTATDAPLMKSIVALIFVLFVIPGVVYGYLAGTVQSHRDIIAGMAKAMSGMGHCIVMASFAARFIAAFGQSNLGALLAIKGADALRDAGLPLQVTLIGIVLLTASIDLLVGSASAKWALIAPVFVPMLVQLGVSPDLAQAAYRVGDSSTNMITPLLPYSVTRLVAWSAWLIVFWSLGLPLGVQASYEYPASR